MPVLSSLAWVALMAATDPKPLSPGDPAPALSIRKWLKGKPMAKLDPKRTYVVEFWATWCGPCKDAMPHLSALARKNKDVTFLGVGLYEDDVNGNLQRFVDRMGARMAYNVAYSGNQDGMAATWMKASGRQGIPASFVVKGGKVVWVGHPMSLDAPLSQIKAGKFDLKAHQKAFAAEVAETRARNAAYRSVQEARLLYGKGKRDEAKAALDQAQAKYPQQASLFEDARFDWLAGEDPAAWETEANALAASKDQNKTWRVTNFAMSAAATPDRKDQARKAIAIALRATEERDMMTLYFASMVYGQTGDDKLALEFVDKALALLPQSEFKGNADFRQELEKAKKDLEAKLAAKP
jgi:thiol-disulfide isomerase/thioredoxin